MVKADVSRDYYADLDVSLNASEEEIKKAFRNLGAFFRPKLFPSQADLCPVAKLYHPDRNPGREIDVVPKFQAVQAAHEILSDPEQKRKYDTDRARRKISAPIIPRRGPVPPTPSQFPPPPRRAASTATWQTSFASNASHPRTRQPPPPVNPEKYAPYARAGAQPWEKTKEEAQSTADAFRGFQQMKPGQSPTAERFAPPPPPPRPPRYTTSERPTSYAPRSAGAAPTNTPRPQRSWDDFKKAGRSTPGTESSPGFPGLSRTQSTRMKQGFTPATPGGDEPPAPRSSAYATYSRGERPQASASYSYFPESTAHPSPQTNPQGPGKSPLRHVRSSSRVEEGGQTQRPGLERISTRYGGIGGERTNIANGSGAHRSSSARNSPIDSKWHESERNGLHSPFSRDNPTRHRSSSPNLRPTPVLDSSSSGSETSSEEEVDEQRWPARPQATPRQARSKPASSDFGGRTAADGPASSGLFPGTNYVIPPTPRDADSGRYQYRPPPLPRNQPTSQAAFNYVPGYSSTRATPQQPMPGAGNEHAGPGVPGNGPNMYAPFHSYPQRWSKSLRVSPSRPSKGVPSLNGFPSWAVPSSVLPHRDTPKKHALDTIREEKRDRIETWRSNTLQSTFVEPSRKHARFADSTLSDSSSPDVDTTKLRNQPSFQNASRENVSEKFSASEWNDKLAGAEDLFRPTSSEIPAKRSPVRSAGSRAKSHSRSHTTPIKESPNGVSTGANGGSGESSTASAVFVPGKFADDWAEKLRYQATATSGEDNRAKTSIRGFKVPAPKLQQTHPKAEPSSGEKQASVSPHASSAGSEQKTNEDVDPMDIDDSVPSNEPSTPSAVTEAAPPHLTTKEKNDSSAAETPGMHPYQSTAADVNLNDLSNVAPLKASGTGLGDLKDLNTTLPFKSKASPARPSQTVVKGAAVSALKALNLPKPPRNVIPPLENATQEAWARYISEMSSYMHDWNIFNKKMLDHFQARQAQLDLTVTSNWMSASGDGPSGEEVSRRIEDDPSSSSQQKAGYAAYRQWMDEDMTVREWWNVACERHQQAILDLGRVREMVKSLAGTIQ